MGLLFPLSLLAQGWESEYAKIENSIRKVQFPDKKHPEEDFDKSFTAYSEYDSTSTLDAVESSLCAEIIEKLVEDIFNAAVAQW